MRSPLVSYVSRAVLNVTQDKATMDPIERNHSLSQTSSCQDSSDQHTKISSDLSLSVYSFGGLFLITGVASLFAILAELLHSNWHRLSPLAWARRDRYPGPSLLVWPNFLRETLTKKLSDAHSSGQVLQKNGSTIVPFNSP